MQHSKSNCFQVIAKCPFYYTLEDVFLSRAGIKATVTNDELFRDMNDFGPSDESENELQDQDSVIELQDQDAVTPAKNRPAKRRSEKKSRNSSGSSSSGGKKAKKKPHGKTGGDDFESAMMSFVKDASARNKAQVTVASKTVALAEDFKRMTDALGSKIKAAYSCNVFVQFLDKDERKQLKYYIADQESSDVSGEGDA